MHRTWTGISFHTWYFTCFNAILPNLPTLSLSHRVHKTVLYISVSFAVLYTRLLLPSSLDSFVFRTLSQCFLSVFSLLLVYLLFFLQSSCITFALREGLWEEHTGVPPASSQSRAASPSLQRGNSLWLRAGELAARCKDGSGVPGDLGAASALQPESGWLGGTQVRPPGSSYSLSTSPARCSSFPPVCGARDQAMKRQSGLQ